MSINEEESHACILVGSQPVCDASGLGPANYFCMILQGIKTHVTIVRKVTASLPI